VGANPSPRVADFTNCPARATTSWQRPAKKWRTNVPIYAKVKYDSVSLAWTWFYYGNQGQLEYDFCVALAPTRERSSSLFKARRKSLLMRAVTGGELDGREMRLHKLLLPAGKGKSKLHNTISRAIRAHGRQPGWFSGVAYDPQKLWLLTPS